MLVFCLAPLTFHLAPFTLVHVVVHGLRLVVLEVGERGGLDADVETPTAVMPERNPGERHLPTMEVARDGNLRRGELVVHDVVTAAERDAGLLADIDRTVETDGLSDVAAVTCGAVVVGRTRIVDRVVEPEIPGKRKIDRKSVV